MLLPLVDFLNHSGDETECFPGDGAVPTANVRYKTAYVLLCKTAVLHALHPKRYELDPRGQEICLHGASMIC